MLRFPEKCVDKEYPLYKWLFLLTWLIPLVKTLSCEIVTPSKSWLRFQFTSDLGWMNHFAIVTKEALWGI